MPRKKTTELYEGLRKVSDSYGENNDCAVIAVAIATGEDYRKVHALFRSIGRRYKGSTPFQFTKRVVSSLDYRLVDVTCEFSARTIVTLERRIPRYGSYLVRVREHILAAKDGRIHDWTRERRHRIKSVLQVLENKP